MNELEINMAITQIDRRNSNMEEGRNTRLLIHRLCGIAKMANMLTSRIRPEFHDQELRETWDKLGEKLKDLKMEVDRS